MKTIRIFGWIWLGVVTLLLLISIAIQVPFVQNAIVQRVVDFAETKIGTPVSLDRISIGFPKRVVLQGLFVEDQQRDTLLYAGEISVDADMLALLSRRIQLNNVTLEQVTANAGRTADGTFNFDYIVDSFSDEGPPQEASGPGWDFTILEVALEQIKMRFDDRLDGNNVSLALGSLRITANEFNLSNNIIDLDGVAIAGVNTDIRKYIQRTAESEPEDTAGVAPGLVISVDRLDLKDIEARYSDTVNGLDISLDLGELRAGDQEIDMTKQMVTGGSSYLGGTFFSYHQLRPDTTNAVPPAPKDANKPEGERSWRIDMDQLTFAENSLQYYDFSTPRVPGLDPGHLWVTDLNFNVSNIALGDNTYRARLNSLSFHESGGLRITDLTADLQVDSTGAIVDDFHLQTAHSQLRFHLESQYPSLSSLGDDLKLATVAAAIDESYVGMADLNLLMPSVLPLIPLHFPDSGKISVDTKISGAVDDIIIERFMVGILDSTALNAHGNLRNVSTPDQLYFDLVLEEFRTTSVDVITLLPDTLLPQSLTLPRWVSIAGEFSGAPKRPDIMADLRSSLGALHIDAMLDFDTTSGQGYAGNVKVSQFDLGKLIRQEGMGVLDLEGSVEGRGMTMDDIDVYAKVTVNEFEFNDYVYHDLFVDGELEKSIFRASASMDDPNLRFDLKGDLDYGYAGVNKQYHFDLDLEQIDLQALNFLNRPLKVQLRLDADLDDADPMNLNGELAIHDAIFDNGEEIFRFDSLLVASVNQEGSSSLNIDSDFLHGAFTGTFDLPSLPAVLKRHFSTYYALDVDSTAPLDSQQFDFSLEILNTSFLTEVLIPDLERITPGEIKGSFDSNENRLELSVAINELVHSSIEATDINLDVTSNRNELEYAFTASNILAGALAVPEVEFDGTVAGDSIETGIVVYDSSRDERYVIRGVFRSLEDAYRFSLLPDHVVLNYDSWSVPDDNAVLITSNGFAAQNLELKFEDQEIHIRAPLGPDSTLNVTLEQLDLQSLVNIAVSDTLVNGTLGGEINVYGSEERGPLEATINIRNLSVQSEPIGDLHIAVDQPVAGQTLLNVRGDGPGLDMRVEGNYNATPGVPPQVQLLAEIESLNLQAVQPFVIRHVSGLKGNLKSNLTIQGFADHPDINGSMTFENAEAVPAFTGSALKLNNETIAFRESTLILNNFTMRDRVDNTLVLDGRVMAGEPYTLNLTARASDFELLNTGEGDNDLFYGQLWLNTTSKVTGTLAHPEIEMTVSLGEDSNFTFVVPQSEAGVMASEGIVVFRDRDKPDSRVAVDETDTLTVRAPFQGITLTSRIELNGKETFTIVLDPLTEDKLIVNGEATLTLDVDATGNMSLSGRYELTRGTYDFTFYNLVKRNFSIEPGSTIVWNGEPLNAELGITARYNINASPIDLFTARAQEGANLDQYRPRLPFLVFLNVKGNLLSPEISFSLDMPGQQQGAVGGSVYARIRDINTRESDLNKQVFALLILQRFVADNPFESQSGGTLQAAARTSVNRMLSEQLNRMTQNIEGMELTFDLQSYEEYQDGRASDRTRLQLGVSKRLLDDRLVVKLSGNVDIEGSGRQSNLTDYIGDLALEYKLTGDGRFRINGFYNSDYDMIDGELREAGVGLIYIKDYDTLRELLKPNNEKTK